MPTDTLNTALKMIIDKFREDYGQNAKLEDGDEIAAVFNDGVIIISVEDQELKIRVSAGEPYRFDYNLGLHEEI